jgi:hypothetical protein
MPVEVKGAIELRKALRDYAPDLALQLQLEMKTALAPIAAKARGFIPSQSPISGWGKSSTTGKFPQWSSTEAKAGIGYKTSPSKANSRGWRALAQIRNKSAAGAIYETAGRVNPYGREQLKTITYTGQGYSFTTSTGKNYGKSNNPEAGSLFIQAMDQYGGIVDANFATGAGRRGRQMKGRAIFRAWKEDGGKANDAVIKAILRAGENFERRGFVWRKAKR